MHGRSKFKKRLAKVLVLAMILTVFIFHIPIQANELKSDFPTPITADITANSSWRIVITTSNLATDGNSRPMLSQTEMIVSSSILAGLVIATTGTAMAFKKRTQVKMPN